MAALASDRMAEDSLEVEWALEASVVLFRDAVADCLCDARHRAWSVGKILSDCLRMVKTILFQVPCLNH